MKNEPSTYIPALAGFYVHIVHNPTQPDSWWDFPQPVLAWEITEKDAFSTPICPSIVSEFDNYILECPDGSFVWGDGEGQERGSTIVAAKMAYEKSLKD